MDLLFSATCLQHSVIENRALWGGTGILPADFSIQAANIKMGESKNSTIDFISHLPVVPNYEKSPAMLGICSRDDELFSDP